MRLSALVLSCAVAGVASGCAATHIVRPLGKGNAAINASLGGPLVTVLGATIPLPILNVGAAYGVRDDLDVMVHVDATAALFGTLHLEPGFALHPIISERGGIPTITVGASLHLLTDFRDIRLGPQLTAAAAWRLKRHMLYVGSDFGMLFGGVFRPIAGPFLGGELRLGKRVGLALEFKWLAHYYDTGPTAPAWVSPGSFGYFSGLLGLNIYLGDVR